MQTAQVVKEDGIGALTVMAPAVATLVSIRVLVVVAVHLVVRVVVSLEVTRHRAFHTVI